MVPALVGSLCVWIMCGDPLLAQVTETPQTVPLRQPGESATAPCLPLDAELCEPAAEPAGCFSTEADYLVRWFKPVCLNVPVISVGNPSAAMPGAIGQPGTNVVVGGTTPHRFDFGATSGLELTAGWQSADKMFGVEVSGFLMDTASASQAFVASPSGGPASYLPYQAPDNSQRALPFTIPGVVTGKSLAIGSTHVWGVEANMTLPFALERGDWTLHGAFLVGGRYLDLTDRDRIFNALSLVADPSAVAVGADQSLTRNQFAGPQLGAVFNMEWGRWSLEYTTKLAAGLTHQTRILEGSPLLATTDFSPLLVPGPLIVLPSNAGRQTAERVTLVPEVGVKTRYALTSSCSLSLGYSLIYWNKVLCPGDQMDATVNVTQLPFHGPVTGPADPKPLFVHTDYFAQGFDLGLLFRF